MKRDLFVLAAIGLVIAIGLAIAVARGALPLLRVFNPLANWSLTKSLVVLAIAVAAMVLSERAIRWTDRGLPWPSATLEWVYSSERAAHIVEDYANQRPQAVRGVLIDSFAFIPFYALSIAILCFVVARGWTSGHWAAWTVALGWSVAFAAAFDYLENAGILAALGGATTRLAPLTYGACQLKWVIACAALDFAIIALIARVFGR